MSNASIIDDLLHHSMDSEISVSYLVKYSSLLADSIGDSEMSEWCEAELNGHEKVPDYRKVYGRLTAEDIYKRTFPVQFNDAQTANVYSLVPVGVTLATLEGMVTNIEPGMSYQFMLPDKPAQNLMKSNPSVISVFWIVQIQALNSVVDHVRNHVFKWAKRLKKNGATLSGSLPKLATKPQPTNDSQITINASTFNTASVGSENVFDGSPVQIATVNSVQNIQYEQSAFDELNIKFDELLKYLDTASKTSEIEQLIAEVNTYRTLVSQPKQRSSWITETLQSIRGILENASGSVLASYADKAQLIDSIAKVTGLG